MFPKLRWHDSIFTRSGYSNNVREVCYALSQLGVDVKCIDPGPYDFIPKGYEHLAMSKMDICVPKDTLIISRIFNPKPFEMYPNFKKAGMVVLEGDRIPEEWVAVANKLDQIWAISTFCKEMFIDNGIVEDIIEVIPHGVRGDIYKPTGETAPLNGGFNFLSVGGHTIPGDRKGLDILIESYCEEFKESEYCNLYIKINSFYNRFSNFNGRDELVKLSRGRKDIFISDEFLDTNELANLYRAADCYVSPNKGEGFGQTIAEAMACGNYIIATGATGHLDFCKRHASLIKCNEKQISHYGPFDIISGNSWVVPDKEHLKELMRYAFDNPQSSKELAIKGCAYIRRYYSWKESAKKTIKAVEKLFK